ncbi:MAG: glycogen debranching enzyme family protein, partial [Acidobacteria bacterium]|nr:glycogen debranching enzyme family protein [Acidobacteriota bacterium]
MNPRNLLHLRRQPPASLSREAPLEWLVTNGLGGYASGSVDGYVRRRFHGLLVASHPAPAGRVMLLHYLQETVTLDGHTRRALRPGPPDAGNVARLDFSLVAGLPQWSFALGPETTLEQSLVMPHDQNTVHVHYRLTGPSPVTLELRPWLDFRAHEGRLSATLDAHYDVTQSGPSGFEFEREGFPIPLRVTIGKDQVGRREAGGGRQSDGTPERDNGAQEPAPPFTFADEPGEWLNVPYDIESDRGYDAVGAMRSPGVFTLTLRPDEDVFFTASSEPWALIEALDPAATRQLELERREHLITVSDAALQSPDTFLLPLAADQFIVRPIARGDADAAVRAAGAEPRTVVAGYPWFTDWGRDTMISLEGLTLCTG